MRLSEHALASKAARIPDMPYLGISLLLLAWHYCLWFVPGSTDALGLLSSHVTSTWLACLACTGIFALAGAALLVRIRVRADVLAGACAAVMAAASPSFLLRLPACRRPSSRSARRRASCSGRRTRAPSSAWAERYTAMRASFSMKAVAPSSQASSSPPCWRPGFFFPPHRSAVHGFASPCLFAVYLRNGKEQGQGRNAPLPLPPVRTRVSMMRCVAALCATAGVSRSPRFSFVSGITPPRIARHGRRTARFFPGTPPSAVGRHRIGAARRRIAREAGRRLCADPFLVAFGIVALCLSLQGGPLCSLAAFSVCIGACVMLEVILVAFFRHACVEGVPFRPSPSRLPVGLPRLAAALGDGCGIALRESGQGRAELVWANIA